MQVVQGYKELPSFWPGCVLAIGNFDGVHRGHQEILRRVRQAALEQGLPSVVYTFRPHPLKLLLPAKAPKILVSYEQKLALLQADTIDGVLEEPFHLEYAALPPETFASEVLYRALRTKAIFVGYDFTFGRGGKATALDLKRLAEALGIQVVVVEPQTDEGNPISSTRIRKALADGDIGLAQRLLGRPPFLQGRVIHGDQRGRLLGWPTANLHTSQEALPAFGVYAAWAFCRGLWWKAVVNIGIRPTFQGDQLRIESHLLDFSHDIYDEILLLSFVERLRPEHRFNSSEALQSQIALDAQTASHLLHSTLPPLLPFAL